MTSGRASRSPVDVAIVGGGIVGAACAAFLVEAGATVALYERTGIAAAASGRNSGVVQHPFDAVLAALYRSSLTEYRALADAAPDAFRIGATPAGLLALDDRGGTGAEATAALWQRAYPASRPELLAGPALAALEPSVAPSVVACRLGIGYPVAPASATRAFATAAERGGAAIQLGVDARLAIGDGTALGVEVDGRLEPAGAVVVAAGPWTPAVIDPSGTWRPIRPVWGVVAAIDLTAAPGHVLEEATIDIEPASAETPLPAGLAGAEDPSFGFSLVTADGVSALGSTFLDTEPVADDLVPALRRRGSRFVPAVASAALVGVRSCARPVTGDMRPLVGPVSGVDRAFVAAGHGPWGISTGPATARMVAGLALGRDVDVPAALDAARFGRIEA